MPDDWPQLLLCIRQHTLTRSSSLNAAAPYTCTQHSKRLIPLGTSQDDAILAYFTPEHAPTQNAPDPTTPAQKPIRFIIIPEVHPAMKLNADLLGPSCSYKQS